MDELGAIRDMHFSAAPVDLELQGAVGCTSEPTNEYGDGAICWQSGLSMRLPRTGRQTLILSARRTRHLVIKRGFDLAAATISLAALLPLLVALAIVIKATSKGPALFRQQREGRGGRPFTIYKFRSLKVDQCDPSGVQQTVEDDTRLTAVGRFIRRTSIDELPQLFNVLLGDMSLVGPRPHVAGMLACGMSYRELVPYYDQRLEVRPGLTGWAQVNGLRGPTTRADLARSRVDHDIAYIENFSFWLDVKIIWRTLRHEFLSGTGR